jgi:hypothetical protein
MRQSRHILMRRLSCARKVAVSMGTLFGRAGWLVRTWSPLRV